MKRSILLIILILLIIILPAYGQRKVETDTLKARAGIKIKSGGQWYDRTPFFQQINSSNQLTADGLDLFTRVERDTTHYSLTSAVPLDTIYSMGLLEHTGTSNYVSVGLGYSQVMQTGCYLKKIKFALWGNSTIEAEVKLYKSASEFTTGTIAGSGLELLQSYTLPVGFNTIDNTLYTFVLTNPVYLAKGEYLTILAKRTGGTTMRINRFTSDPNGNRNNLLYCALADPWTASWSAGTYPSYCGSPMQLFSAEPSWADKNELKKIAGYKAKSITYIDTSNYQISTGWTSDTTFIHSRGVSESAPNSTYYVSGYSLGYSMQITKPTIFNTLKYYFKAAANSDLTIRLYRSDNRFLTGTISANNLTLIDSVNYAAGNAPVVSDIQTISLDSTIYMNEGEFLTILLHSNSGTTPTIGRWTTDPYSDRLGFLLTANDPWTGAWSTGGATYYGAPFILMQIPPGSLFDPQLLLPDTVYMSASGSTEYNIYFDNLSLTENYKNYHWLVTCDSGQTFEQGWRWTPASGTSGNFTLKIEIYDREYTNLDYATTVLAVASNNMTASKDIIMIGNSLTAAGTYPTEVNALADGSLTLYGTQGTSPNNHEGHSGKTYSWFENDATSPLVDGSGNVDFTGYLSDNSFPDPDFVTLFLGINDLFGANHTTIETSINNVISYADSIIANIKDATTDRAIIGLAMITPPAYNQDAFGTNYDNYQTWKVKRNYHRFNERLKAYYGTGGSGEQGNVYLIPVYLGLDTEHNYPTTNAQYNARNSSTYIRQTNGVHPATSGYYQIADWFFGFIVNHQ